MLSPITQFRQQYDVGEQIGRGAFAICYKATHKTTRQVVAAKKISFLGEDESTTKAISNEISLLKSITHPNIIKFIAGYSDKNYAIILTEYEQSRDLQYKITHLKRQSKKFSQKQLIYIFHQILQGLAHLHSHNIMHRDIKPSNIFIDADNRVKIGDLGASKIVQELNFTRIGTPYYLPPEIIRHQSYSFSADIWSLGVTLYHMAYLEPPFKAGNVIKLGQLIVESEPQYPQNGCSHRVEEAIRRMLVKNQNLRPSAKELLQIFFKEDLSDISPEITEQIQEQQPQESKEEPCKTVLQFQFVRQEQYIEKESYINEATGKTITIRKYILENNDNEDNIEQQFVKPMPCPKRLTRTRSIENRFYERRMTHIGKEIIDQNESTIVLTVNPLDSRHQSVAASQKKTFFSNESIAQLSHYKKSSCFKDCIKNETPNTSNFCEFKAYDKNRESTYGHKREPSAIQKRQKHSELMQKIKPLKAQNTMRPEEWQKYEQGKQGRQRKEGRVKVTVDVPSFVVLR